MRIAPLVIICVLLAACGGKSQTDEVRSTVNGWLSTLAVGNKDKGESAKACAYLTRGLRNSIDVQLRMRGEHATCKTFAANWTGRSTPPGNRGAHVTKVVVTGTTAQASLAAPPDRASEVKLRKVGGRWLIDNY